MTKCPQCGFDETQVINQKLASHKMSHYVDEKGVNVGVMTGDEAKVTTSSGRVLVRKDLWKAPTETQKPEPKK